MKTPRYSVSRKRHKETFTCLHCGGIFSYNKASLNKYCSMECSRAKLKNTRYLKLEESGKGGPSICKTYLIEKFGNICSICGQIPLWNNKKLVLQLDHIDGNSDNNFPYNIRLLCPNCHTQTETFGNAGKGNRYKKVTKRNKWLQEYKNAPVV